ncbi:MAG: hypothetical protein DRR19_03890 [Candidatus Parabeggiatoa sp. nov. 1]|nr:MAG: hypothetical protein DRR19_03890 [Gammaproteobacteria bacterium]
MEPAKLKSLLQFLRSKNWTPHLTRQNQVDRVLENITKFWPPIQISKTDKKHDKVSVKAGQPII